MWGELIDDSSGHEASNPTTVEYLYIAMELCSTTLQKKLTEMTEMQRNWTKKKTHWLWMSETLMSIAKGLAFIHSRGKLFS